MARWLASLAIGAASLLGAAPAIACIAALPDIAPMNQGYGATVLATEVSQDEDGARVRFGRALRGPAQAGEAQLDLRYYGGSCGPYGPRPGTGETLVVYFTRRYGRWGISRWATLDEAAAVDPLVWVDRARVGAARRRQLLARARLVYRVRGPIPLTRAESWVAPSRGGLGWNDNGGPFTRVAFDVTDDGRMINCRRWMSFDPDRSAEICARIRSRRFRPPVLPQERHGVYEMRWDQ
jgi:hypothetical protein